MQNCFEHAIKSLIVSDRQACLNIYKSEGYVLASLPDLDADDTHGCFIFHKISYTWNFYLCVSFIELAKSRLLNQVVNLIVIILILRCLSF